MDSAQYVCAIKTGGAAGSNVGGFYTGADGKQYYVKEYADPTQAHGEVLANEIYNALGIGAAKAGTFMHNGKLMYASEIIPGVTTQAQVGNLGLTKARAQGILEGFAADLLTANWDVVGLSLDNVVEIGGKIYRIDNGASFLHRAQGSKKADQFLNSLTEWEGFSPGPGNHNKQYAQVFKAAGYDTPDQMGKFFLDQVEKIDALHSSLGPKGWGVLVDAKAPNLNPVDRQKIIAMLEKRHKLIQGKAIQIKAQMGTQSLPVTVGTPIAAPVQGGPKTVTLGEWQAMTKKQHIEYCVLNGISPGHLSSAELLAKVQKKGLIGALPQPVAPLAPVGPKVVTADEWSKMTKKQHIDHAVAWGVNPGHFSSAELLAKVTKKGGVEVLMHNGIPVPMTTSSLIALDAKDKLKLLGPALYDEYKYGTKSMDAILHEVTLAAKSPLPTGQLPPVAVPQPATHAPITFSSMDPNTLPKISIDAMKIMPTDILDDYIFAATGIHLSSYSTMLEAMDAANIAVGSMHKMAGTKPDFIASSTVDKWLTAHGIDPHNYPSAIAPTTGSKTWANVPPNKLPNIASSIINTWPDSAINGYVLAATNKPLSAYPNKDVAIHSAKETIKAMKGMALLTHGEVQPFLDAYGIDPHNYPGTTTPKKVVMPSGATVTHPNDLYVLSYSDLKATVGIKLLDEWHAGNISDQEMFDYVMGNKAIPLSATPAAQTVQVSQLGFTLPKSKGDWYSMSDIDSDELVQELVDANLLPQHLVYKFKSVGSGGMAWVDLEGPLKQYELQHPQTAVPVHQPPVTSPAFSHYQSVYVTPAFSVTGSDILANGVSMPKTVDQLSKMTINEIEALVGKDVAKLLDHGLLSFDEVYNQLYMDYGAATVAGKVTIAPSAHTPPPPPTSAAKMPTNIGEFMSLSDSEVEHVLDTLNKAGVLDPDVYTIWKTKGVSNIGWGSLKPSIATFGSGTTAPVTPPPAPAPTKMTPAKWASMTKAQHIAYVQQHNISPGHLSSKELYQKLEKKGLTDQTQGPVLTKPHLVPPPPPASTNLNGSYAPVVMPTSGPPIPAGAKTPAVPNDPKSYHGPLPKTFSEFTALTYGQQKYLFVAYLGGSQGQLGLSAEEAFMAFKVKIAKGGGLPMPKSYADWLHSSASYKDAVLKTLVDNGYMSYGNDPAASWSVIEQHLSAAKEPFSLVGVPGQQVITPLGTYRGFQSFQEGNAWARSHWKPGSLPATQRSALRTYTTGAYTRINSALRSAKGDISKLSGSTLSEVKAIDAAMATHTIPESVVVGRGTGLSEFGGRVPVPGEVHTQHGYWSSSVGPRGAFGGEVLLHIHAPAGTHAWYVDEFSANQGEWELVFARDTKFKVLSVKTKSGYSGKYEVEVEIIP